MDKVQFALVVLAFLSYVAGLVFAYLNGSGVTDLFHHRIGDLDNKYFQQVSPKGIAFGIIWPIIYIWNLAGIVYILVSCFLPADRSPVLMIPTLVPKTFLVGYSVIFIATVGWLFTFDREMLGLAFACLLISALASYFCIGISCKVVAENAVSLEKQNKAVLWLMRILIHNGLSTLATWLTVATLINLADVLIYKDSPGSPTGILRGIVSMVNGSSVSLVLLLVIVITWFVLENFVFESYCRYIYTIYPVLVLGLSALIAKLRELPDARQNLIICSIDLGVVLVAFIARIALEASRSAGAVGRL